MPTRRELLRNGLGLAALAGMSPLLGACGSDDDGASADGTVTITMWHGQENQGKDTLDKIVAAFNAKNPKIKVNASSGGVLADSMLQKITTALASGKYPDIAYIFGPDIANVARSPKVANLQPFITQPDVNWDDYYPAARDAVTVDGKVRGFPALIDNLCVAYNKKIFAAAGVPEPTGDWTWDEYVATAKRLTDPAKGTFGTGWPAAGDEDCVWRIYPLIWDLGGSIVDGSGKKIGFDNDSGLKALQVVHQLGADKSVYADTKPGSDQMYQVFTSGKMAMIPTGPWELPVFIEAKSDYGVVPLPTFSGKRVTIAGPDTWTVFDNGKAKVKAAVEFLKFLTSGDQDVQWATEAGSLPLRKSTANLAEWKQHVDTTVGLKPFSDALAYAKTRPTIRKYPQISEPLGQAIVKMLLGQGTPEGALSELAKNANAALATP
ncbi:ABC transporter substrate-binding protein [Rugosimonospora africana]|uniref:ABC transporter substrate-binding protein n=1 Tax=Rugosimonospora africana TaxID=556532 RepID=A0A8J3QUR6_9ACTN|nr:ABC transporter substrate-binding protein [Rugosimonospora africana]GIH16175.1 ABC transporter substrate-binding protein [Rugosimonospora africana]